MSDNNYKSYGDTDGLHIDGLVVDPEAAGVDMRTLDDVLKFSHLTNSSFYGGQVVAGDARENAIDANRYCTGVTVSGFKLSGGRQASIVVKGGSQLVFNDIIISAHPDSWCDVLVDDWSDQSQEPSLVALSNVRRLDGKPVRVVYGRFRKPTFIGGNCKVSWTLTVGLHAYVFFKGLGVKLGLIKLPPGCPVTAATGYRQIIPS